MTPDLIELARRAVALTRFPKPIRKEDRHPGWGDGVYRDDRGIRWVLVPCTTAGDWLPDFGDPATCGVLFHLVRWAWKRPALTLTGGPGEWRVNVCMCGCVGDARPLYRDQKVCGTEAAALLAAMEAAP